MRYSLHVRTSVRSCLYSNCPLVDILGLLECRVNSTELRCAKALIFYDLDLVNSFLCLFCFIAIPESFLIGEEKY